MFDRLHDARVRGAAFDWLTDQVEQHGDVLSRSLLAEGFVIDGERVPLVGPQGIFKPRIMEVPLTITTAPRGPYDDSFGTDGLLQYRYRGTDRNHRDNVGLRFLMQEQLPLAYFHGVVPGRYVPAWPVFVVGDHPETFTFSVAVDDAQHTGLKDPTPMAVHDAANEGRRRYITAAVRRRVHQRAFRQRVLEAYRTQCSFCRFRHEELLDAAHIIPDVDLLGEPIVSNGLALCRFHHAAFDKGFIGVRPDYVLEVRPDLLEEADGPTLVHSIQQLHEKRIQIPTKRSQWPSPERLAARYQQFQLGRRVS